MHHKFTNLIKGHSGTLTHLDTLTHIHILNKKWHPRRKDLPIALTIHAEKDLNITGNWPTMIASLPVQQNKSNA